jgi:isopentenyl phosphate kinase
MEITKEEIGRRFRERTTKNLLKNLLKTSQKTSSLILTMGGGSFLYRKASANNQIKV